MKNIMIDIAFPIETEKDFENLNREEILSALLGRIASLIDHWEPDAFGFCGSYIIDEEDKDGGTGN